MNFQQLMHAIKDMSSRPQDLAQLLQQLKLSDDSLRNQNQKLPEALAHLDPASESLGYLYLL